MSSYTWKDSHGNGVLTVTEGRITFPTGVFVYDPAMCALLERLAPFDTVVPSSVGLAATQVVDANDPFMTWVISRSGEEIEARVGGDCVFVVDSTGLAVWRKSFYFVLPMPLWVCVISYLESIL